MSRGGDAWTWSADPPVASGRFGRADPEASTERHARRTEAVARLGRLALGGAALPEVMDAAVQMVADVVGADYAAVFLPRAHGPRLELVASHGVPASVRADPVLAARAAPPVESLHAGEVVLVPDWRVESRWRAPAHAATLGVRSSVAVPITARATRGLLTAHRRRPWTPVRDDTAFLENVANVIAALLNRAATEEALLESTLRDPLTGLANRALVLDRLEHALGRSTRRGHGVGVIVLELDRLRMVNRALGPAAGDAVVLEAARRLRAAARPGDTVGRLGGTEFAVVLEELRRKHAVTAIAARMVDVFREPFAVGDDALAVTVSAGVALGCPETADAGALLRDAGIALDGAKARGRDRFEIADADLRRRTAERAALERDLRAGLARGEIVVAYQPIVAIADGQVTGVEALARWRHPERGLVGPGEFIALAEEAGLIAQLGRAVLRAACVQVAAWRTGGRGPTCHVNLSPLQVADPAIVGHVADALAVSGLEPEALVLEITESSLLEGGQEPLDRLQDLRGLGVRLVLDDFGTGYSSLSRLRSCPVDGLKVDRAFVADLPGEDGQGGLLVAGILGMARALGLTVVAEGVETSAQLEHLRGLGCRYAQGFLLSRPVDADAACAVVGGRLPAP